MPVAEDIQELIERTEVEARHTWVVVVDAAVEEVVHQIPVEGIRDEQLALVRELHPHPVEEVVVPRLHRE